MYESSSIFDVDSHTHRRASHSQFQGRAEEAFCAIPDDVPADCDGHGTHVAGIIGAERYGVAPGVRIFGVKVMDCKGVGSVSNVLKGLQWIIDNHKKPAIINLSLGTIDLSA